MPPRETIGHPIQENNAWLGRAAALVDEWDKAAAIRFQGQVDRFYANARERSVALSQLLTTLHQARNSLRMKTVGPVNAALGQGMVFDYFDDIRQIIEPARHEVFFVDPYLNAEFVGRYLD